MTEIEVEDYIGIALRASVMYVNVLAIVRLSGKRSIGNLSPLDFVVALIVGDLFDDVFWAEVPLAKGMVAVTTVVLLHSLVAYATYKSTWIANFIDSARVALALDGHLVMGGLRRERFREQELFSELRHKQVSDIAEVREASLEPSGHTSVLMREESKPVQRQDLAQLPQFELEMSF